MAVSTIKTTQMTWGFLNSRLNREPVDAASLNNSYTDLLWELNQASSTYVIGQNNTGGSSNYYVGLITAVPYINKGNGKNEDPRMKGPWYVTYCAADPNEGKGKYAFTGHIDDPVTALNTYYADRIVLKRELDYALDENTISPMLIGSYYTGVGMWWDSYNTINGGSRQYIEKGLELPDNTYFTTISYAEIFNDYAYNKAEGNYSHAEGYHSYAIGIYSHVEGSKSLANGSTSHAEGNKTHAKGDNSHAEGSQTYAEGKNSHAEGNQTEAIGESSHAGGKNSKAIGDQSFASGENILTYNPNEHGFGKNNISVIANEDNAGTLFTIGDGNNEKERHNIISIYNNRDIETENHNIVNHTSGNIVNNVDGNIEEIFNSSHTVTTYKTALTYTYSNTYTYTGGNSDSYTIGNKNERSDTSVYLSAPKICIHGDTTKENTYVDISSTSGYLYGSDVVYLGESVHNQTTPITYVKGTTINEVSTNHNKSTETSVTTVSGKSTVKTGTLELSSGETNINLDETHIHVKNNICIKSDNGDAVFKGNNYTIIGKDFENNETNNFLINSTNNGEITSNIIELNADKQYRENVGEKIVNINGRLTEIRDEEVSITNSYNYGTYTSGTAYIFVGKTSNDIANIREIYTYGSANITNNGGLNIATFNNHYEKIFGNRRVEISHFDKDHNGSDEYVCYGDSNNHIFGKYNIYASEYSYSHYDSGNEINIKGKKLEAIEGNSEEYVSGSKIEEISYGKCLQINNNGLTINVKNSYSTYINSNHVNIGYSYNNTRGNYSTSIGEGIINDFDNSLIVGAYNYVDDASYFTVGIGTSDKNRKNALWISQGNTEETNGVTYFSNSTYVYTNAYDPDTYPEKKEEKKMSKVITYDYFKNSYTYLYDAINDKFNALGTYTYYTKSIDEVSATPTYNTIHYTTQTFNIDDNTFPTTSYTINIQRATPGTLENDDTGTAGLMSARDKARLDSIWEGDKQIAKIEISTGNWTVYKNDGKTTYAITSIEQHSDENSKTSLSIEYGFKVKWSGTWRWTVNNQKNAERCDGTWGSSTSEKNPIKLPKVNENSDIWTSSILSSAGTIATQSIYATKRGLVISGYPDWAGASNNGSQHLGSIIPASGEDYRSCSVSWSVYKLLFYGQTTLDQAKNMDIGVISKLTNSKITSLSWTINYVATGTTCFVMAYPVSYGEIKTIKKNGVEIITSSFLQVGKVKYTNGAGLTQEYYVYRSGVGTASMSITIS